MQARAADEAAGPAGGEGDDSGAAGPGPGSQAAAAAAAAAKGRSRPAATTGRASRKAVPAVGSDEDSEGNDGSGGSDEGAETDEYSDDIGEGDVVGQLAYGGIGSSRQVDMKKAAAAAAAYGDGMVSEGKYRDPSLYISRQRDGSLRDESFEAETRAAELASAVLDLTGEDQEGTAGAWHEAQRLYGMLMACSYHAVCSNSCGKSSVCVSRLGVN